jgi:DNA-binding XRE family transcriptional regulator
VLAVFGNGDATLLKRPLGETDDGSPVASITISDDEATAVLELQSGASCVVRASDGGHGNAQAVALDGEKLGARLKAFRLAAGLTQAELARRTGIHRPNIARVEAGRHTPSLETLSRIANAIGVSPTEVLSAD